MRIRVCVCVCVCVRACMCMHACVSIHLTGMGIKNGKVSGKVGACGPHKASSGGPRGNGPGGGQRAKPPEAF